MKKQLLLIISVLYSSLTLIAQPVLENHIPPIGSSYMLNKITSKISKAAPGGYQIWDYSTATTSPMYNYSILAKSTVNQTIQDSFPNVTYIEMLQIGAPDLNLNPMVFYQDMGSHIRRLGDKGSGSNIQRREDTLMLFNQAYMSTVFYGMNQTTYAGYGQLKVKNKTFDSVAMITYVRPPSTDTVVMFVQIKPYFHRVFGYNLVSDTIGATYYWEPSPPPATAVKDIQSEITLNLFPNPAKNTVHVQINDQIKLQQIGLYDITGQQVLSVNTEHVSTHQLDVSSLSKGIYFLQIKTEHNNLTRKLIIE